MAKQSAGILVYRLRHSVLEVLLVHPGGPYWKSKDAGAWSVPKGNLEEGEDALQTAKRELQEETGCCIEGDFMPLTSLKQPGGKLVHVWAVEGDFDVQRFKSNSFRLEWPPKSGQYEDFPEVDRAGWFTIPEAIEKLLRGQRGFLEELLLGIDERPG